MLVHIFIWRSIAINRKWMKDDGDQRCGLQWWCCWRVLVFKSMKSSTANGFHSLQKATEMWLRLYLFQILHYWQKILYFFLFSWGFPSHTVPPTAASLWYGWKYWLSIRTSGCVQAKVLGAESTQLSSIGCKSKKKYGMPMPHRT